MNLVLVDNDDFISNDTVELSDRRFEHLSSVINISETKICQVGQINGLIGTGKLVTISDSSLQLKLKLTKNPPKPRPVTLIVALPRPKGFRKILHSAVSMGVKEIYMINAFKVDKSYWTSPLFQEEARDLEIRLALEQAVDTIYPKIHFKRFFKPFVEDELPTITSDNKCYIAHPDSPKDCPVGLTQPITLCIGPEGGFTDYEVNLLKKQGATPITLGPRILRTEFAITALLSRLYL